MILTDFGNRISKELQPCEIFTILNLPHEILQLYHMFMSWCGIIWGNEQMGWHLLILQLPHLTGKKLAANIINSSALRMYAKNSSRIIITS